jgi:uncharacterized protein (DUF983 family)
VRWHSADAVAPPEPQPALAALETKTAMLRGLRGACPACGQGKLFAGFLAVSDSCATCGEKLGQIRADDAPPYFTIFAVGHVVVPGMLWLEKAYAPDLWIHAAIWLPLTLGLTLAMIRPVKGATIGLMLKLGFGRDAGQP